MDLWPTLEIFTKVIFAKLNYSINILGTSVKAIFGSRTAVGGYIPIKFGNV